MDLRDAIKQSVLEDVDEVEAEKITSRIMESLSEVERLRAEGRTGLSREEIMKRLREDSE